jgi:hypothetical protein
MNNDVWIGRGDRIRTYDPLLPKQMRYQAALLPDWGWPLGLPGVLRKGERWSILHRRILLVRDGVAQGDCGRGDVLQAVKRDDAGGQGAAQRGVAAASP